MKKEILIQWIQDRINLVNNRDNMDFALYYLGLDKYSIKYNFKMIDKYYGNYTKELVFGTLEQIHEFIKDL